MSLARSHVRFALVHRLVWASLLTWVAPAALAQDKRPWIDPPASQAASPTEPTVSGEPSPPSGSAAPSSGPRADPVRPPQVPPPAASEGSSRASRPSQATRIETPAPPSRSSRTSPASVSPAAPVPRVIRRVDVPREQRPRIPVARAVPSFDCRYARTSVERAICADPILASKDRQMALLYEQQGGSRHGPVDEWQWRWLAARNACVRAPSGALESCIGRAYDTRIAELSGARR